MTPGRGDTAARDIVNRVCTAPVAAARAAGSAKRAVGGGVTGHPYFSVKPTAVPAQAGITLIRSGGRALDTAALILARTDLASDERIIRG